MEMVFVDGEGMELRADKYLDNRDSGKNQLAGNCFCWEEDLPDERSIRVELRSLGFARHVRGVD